MRSSLSRGDLHYSTRGAGTARLAARSECCSRAALRAGGRSGPRRTAPARQSGYTRSNPVTALTHHTLAAAAAAAAAKNSAAHTHRDASLAASPPTLPPHPHRHFIMFKFIFRLLNFILSHFLGRVFSNYVYSFFYFIRVYCYAEFDVRLWYLKKHYGASSFFMFLLLCLNFT